ncbi:MAG: putative nuclear RNA export factor SDE5 [Phycisphaerales bacterium]|nr:putative nuclear RNA export factor SDE5 [Phycisphaerales bacterium]
MRSVLGMRTRFGAAAIAGVVGLVTCLASPALAQGGGRGGQGGGPGGGMRGMMGDMFSSPVTTREIDLFTQVAGLTTDQKDTAKTLLEGYQEQFRAKSAKVQKEMEKVREKFQDTRDPSVWQDMRGSMQTFRAERKTMEEQFFSDFKAILTKEQVERWPLIERAHRRSRTMSRGMISGERVDLVEIMESSKFPAEVQATVLPALSEYEESLDRELITRNQAYDEVAEAFSQGSPQDGFAKAQDLMVKGRDASMRVRELNRKYARQISDSLPEEYKTPFDDSVKRASYPDVYRSTDADRMIAAAEKFTDLDQAQKDSLTALRENRARTLAGINEKLAAAITEREEKFDPRQMGQRFGGGRGGNAGRGGGGQGNNADDPIGALRRERRELDNAAEESLKKILTKEQVGRLPEDDDSGGDRRGGQRRGNTNQEI